MTIEEFKSKRTERLKSLHEKLSNMPELIDDGKAHVEVDAVTGEAIKSSEERDEQIKDTFKDKNKEVRQFIKDQDKATETDKDEKEKAEDKLFLNESLFDESVDDVQGKVWDYLYDTYYNAINVYEIMNKVPGYNPDWSDDEEDEIYIDYQNKVDELVEATMKCLFKNK